MLHQRYRRPAHSRLFLARSGCCYALGALAIFGVCALLFISLAGTDRRRLPNVTDEDEQSFQVLSGISSEEMEQLISLLPKLDEALAKYDEQYHGSASSRKEDYITDLHWLEYEIARRATTNNLTQGDHEDAAQPQEHEKFMAMSTPDLYKQCERLEALADRNAQLRLRDEIKSTIRYINLLPIPEAVRQTYSEYAEAMEHDLQTPRPLSKNESDVTGPPVIWSSCVIL